LNFGRGQRFFSSPKCQDQFWVPHGLLLDGYWVYFLRIKMLGHDVNHPLPPRAEVGGYLHGVDRDDFTCHS